MRPIQTLAAMLTLLIFSCSDKSTDRPPPPSFDLGPYQSDSATLGLWHFDEASGTVVADSSTFHNTGTAFNATIASGKYVYSRSFNGTTSYVNVPHDSSLNLDTTSFTIDLWFKTVTSAGEFMLRKGLAPVPGFYVAINSGRVIGMIGNREDSSWPDTLISIWSDSTFNDNQWHLVSFIRNRETHKLILYVDGKLAAQPVDDNFTIPLNSNNPLTIGRWENPTFPSFFTGSIDEVRIKRGVHH